MILLYSEELHDIFIVECKDTFGFACKQKCGHCDNKCNNVNGFCDKCKKDYIGSYCYESKKMF